MFFSRDIEDKLNAWVEKGRVGKVIKIATTDENKTNRAKAYAALGRIRAKEACETLLDCFKKDEEDVVKYNAAMALGRIATKKEFDTIQHFIQQETSERVIKALNDTLLEAKDRAPRW